MKMNNLNLATAMLARDWRAGEWRVLLIALVLAVGSISTVGLFSDRVRQALQQEAHSLLGADLRINSIRPIPQAYRAAAQQRGLRVAEGGTPILRTLRVDAGAAATGVADTTVRLLPTIVLRPTPTPMPLDAGPQVPLTDLTPRGVEFGFEPPQFDRAWGGDDIVMRGVRYPRGIGVHAWTRLTYDVPDGATTFQSVVGLSDDVCDEAAVAFEVYDEQGRQLYASGVIDPTTGPRFVRVPVTGVAAVTLVVTEGENGRDCDHANWARAAFLLGAPPPTAAPGAAPGGT